MKLQKCRAGGNIVKCDLGQGGLHYPVGTSRQIWANQSTLTLQALAQAQAATNKGTAMPVAALQQQLAQMKVKLKQELETADVEWKKWVPTI